MFSINKIKKVILIALSMVLIISVFLSMEALSRFNQYYKTTDKKWLCYGPTHEKQVEFRFDLNEFGTYAKMNPKNWSAAKINSFGFRGKEFSMKKPKGIYRIVVLGGSSTFGAENDDTHTYPYLLEQLLNKTSADKYEVINAGIPGANTYNVYELFKHEVVELNPDMVIVKIFYNHFVRFSPPVGILQKTLHFLEQRSVFFLKLKEKLYSITNKGYINATNYGYYLEEILKLAKQKGIKIVLVREPLLLNKGVKIAINNPKYYDINLQIIDKLGKEYNAIIANGARLSTKDNKDGVFIDTVHLTNKGNQLLAEIIYDSLKGKISN